MLPICNLMSQALFSVTTARLPRAVVMTVDNTFSVKIALPSKEETSRRHLGLSCTSMPFQSQFSLSLELAKVLPVRQIVNAAAEQIIGLVRELKRDGSDFLVEEDLANIFGRGRIEPSLEEDFRKAVRIGSIQPLHADSPIALDSSPGATVRRALKDRFYMSSVIQLSFLIWMHEETTLAAALAEGMRSRYESKIQGATSDPDYDGILKTLQACSQQTSQYRWDDLCILIEKCFRKSRPWFSVAHYPLKKLSSNILLGAMDYLYMAQTLPEDRLVMVNSQTGLVPMVIWAHYILGLNVLIKSSPDGDVVFGHVERPQVIIQWNSTLPLDSAPLHGQRSSGLSYPERVPPTDIYLLDADMHVILKTESVPDNRVDIEGQEYHRLRGYGTTYLERYFNSQRFVADDDPVIADTANFAVSIAILMSRAAAAGQASWSIRDFLRNGDDTQEQRYINTELWRIFDSSNLILWGIKLDKKRIVDQLDKLSGKKLLDMAVPTSLRNFFEDSGELQVESYKSEILGCLRKLATWILAFGQVIDIKSCSDLPLCIAPGAEDCPDITKRWDGSGFIIIEPYGFFELIRTLRINSRAGMWSDQLGGLPFLACYQGWSLFYSCVGDYDPQDINCDLLCIKHGVPTNTRTNERKYGIVGAPVLGFGGGPSMILDKKDSYFPRCVTKVVKRTEHYSSRSSEFWLSIRFDVENQLDFHHPSCSQQTRSDQRYSVYASYGIFQAAIWNVFKTPPCTHQIEDVRSLPLDLDVQTIGGLPNGFGLFGSERSEARIYICLVKGDARARWLAICSSQRARDSSRRFLLRCNGCCEDCAVKTASSMKGEWFVVL